jgi:biopolymer transport protein TolQ
MNEVSLLDAGWQSSFPTKLILCATIFYFFWILAIILDRLQLYSRTRRAIDRFEAAFWSGESIEELYRALSGVSTRSVAACFVAGMREWKRSFEGQARSFAGLQTRIDKIMKVTTEREAERLERRLTVLSTIGSFSTPFISLTGVFWGLDSSLRISLGAAAKENVPTLVSAAGAINLAFIIVSFCLCISVASKVFFDKFSTDAKRLIQRQRDFADEFSAIVSRLIDERA